MLMRAIIVTQCIERNPLTTGWCEGCAYGMGLFPENYFESEGLGFINDTITLGYVSGRTTHTGWSAPASLFAPLRYDDVCGAQFRA